FSICGTTPGGGCTDCTQQAFSICGTTPGIGCSDCTQQAFSICGTTPGPGCTDCTFQAFSICGTTPGLGCSDCTQQAFSICGTTPGAGCDGGTRQACFAGTIDTPFPHCGGTRLCGGTIACGGSMVDPAGPRIDVDSIRQLKTQLQQRLAELDEQEKALGPKSLEEIDVREREITAELERIRGIRKGFKK
ncbi:MAG TPA: hypothetical protein VF111_07220, partial [Thermoanaerobaculia bacterium]